MGRTTSRKPTPEELKKPCPIDKQKAKDYAFLGGLDLAEVEAEADKLLCAYWPLVRRLAQALVERREISGRCIRQILLRALRKDLRRARAIAEKDRRNQQAWAAELRRALSQVA